MKLDIVAVEKAVRHQLPGMLRVYNHYDYFDEQLLVMQVWGRKLQALAPKKKETISPTKATFLRRHFGI